MLRKHNLKHPLVLFFFTWLLSVSTLIHASGFAIIEQSTKSQGTSFAGIAAIAEDASTVFFNPAGMTQLTSKMEVANGGALIFPQADFNNKGSVNALGAPLNGNEDISEEIALVPSFYYVTTLPNDMKFGLGISAPFGLVTKYDKKWIGRYHGIRSALTTLNINPAIAWKATDLLSIGLGLNIQYAEAKLSNAIDFGTICFNSFPAEICTNRGLIPNQTDGLVDAIADDWSFGFNIGLLFNMTKNTRIGLHYRSDIEQATEGDAKFGIPAAALFLTQSGAFQNTNITATVTLPEIISFSIAQTLDNTPLTLLADITWTRWSRFDELRIKFSNPAQPDSAQPENWEDTFRYSLGLNYKLNPKTTLRTGIAYDETPIPGVEDTTPRLPGNNRTWLSFGGSYQYSEMIQVDLGYSHLFISDTDIDNINQGNRLVGSYSFNVDILSAQLRFTF